MKMKHRSLNLSNRFQKQPFRALRKMVMYKRYSGIFAVALLTSISQTVDAGGRAAPCARKRRLR